MPQRQPRLIRNRVQCPTCKEIIESKSRHDFVVCGCWDPVEGGSGVFVDGGLDYQRSGGMVVPIDLAEYADGN